MGAHREGVWTGHDARLCPIERNWNRLAVEGGGLLGGAAALAFFAAPFGLAVPVAAVVLGFGAFGLIARHADERRRQDGTPVQELREEFGVGPVWKVDLLVRQGEAPSGCDRGLMWMEDGQIVFSGLRTSFALVPEQTVGAVRYLPELKGQRLRMNLQLACTTTVGPLSLSFWPIGEGFRREESDASDLRFALNRTLNGTARGLQETSGQWPPLTRGPGAPRPEAMLRRALLPHAGWTSAAALLGLVASGFAPWIGFLVFAVGAIVVNVAVRAGNVLRWQAWRDACQIWRAA